MKKINIGIVLIIFSIIGFVVFIIYSENIKEEDKKYALEFVKEYFEVYNKYSVLDNEERDINKNIDEEKYNNYLLKMKEELSDYIFDSRLDYFFGLYKGRLDNQVKGKYMMHKYVKEIAEVVDYNFDREYINLQIKINIDVEQDRRISPTFNKNTNKYIGMVEYVKGIEKNGEICEIICLKKISNKEYKIVSHGILDLYKYSFENDGEENIWGI